MIIVSGTYDDQVNVYAIVCFVQASYLGLHVARYRAVTDRDKWMIISLTTLKIFVYNSCSI